MRNGVLVLLLLRLLKLAKQVSKVLVRFLLPLRLSLTLLFVCCCCFISFFSTKNSSTFNLVMTVLHIAFVLFIIVAGFAKGDVRNLTAAAASAGGAGGGGAAATDSANGGGGFAPFGMRGIFNAAAIVYFSYIGYDAVSTTAEEVKNPAKNMTIGLSGSVIAVTILYCFIALALCMLQPYNLVSRRKILRAKLLLVLCTLESSSCSLSAAHHFCFLFASLREGGREMRPGLIKLSFFL